MLDPLRDLSHRNLTHAIEENLFALVPAIRRWPRATGHADGQVRWSLTDVPFPVFNSVFAARTPAAQADALIEAMVDRAGDRGVPLLWWTGPRTQPSDFGERLERHGFVAMPNLAGMAVEIDHCSAGEPAPAGLIVRRVQEADELTAWSATCAAALELPDPIADANHDFMRHVDRRATHAYVGWLDSAPVATSVAMYGGGVVGIYNVATLPGLRRRGIGRAMTAAPIRDARIVGCRAAILHATAMAERVYRTMGFREYCRIGQYVWSPAPSPSME